MERAEAVKLIETKTNAAYSESSSWDSSYPVASRSATEKAVSAAKRGIMVVNEDQMLEFMGRGEFPPLP